MLLMLPGSVSEKDGLKSMSKSTNLKKCHEVIN